MDKKQGKCLHLYGNAEGTTYSIIYYDNKERNLKSQIDSILAKIEKSLSVYDKDSLISRINRNEVIEVDDYFFDVFLTAKDIYKKTSGVFDISAEPLFKAWGFSFQNREEMNDSKVTDLKKLIGMDKIRIENRQIVKSDPDMILNMNSIAKGYSVDVIADYLESENITDFLIEIGGEIRLKGLNQKDEKWIIGVDKPIYGNYNPGQQIQTYLQLTDKAIATSGEYRRFYIDEDGNRFSHTIDPRTGYPIMHNLRSVTVIAEDTISADAVATAFMVMGLKESLEYLENSTIFEAMFIYEEENTLKVEYSSNMRDYIYL